MLIYWQAAPIEGGLVVDGTKPRGTKMDAVEKAAFISELCDAIKDKVISRIGYMPDEWNGLELREYLAHEFANECILSRNPNPDKKRLREFKNTCAVKFGL